MVTIVFETHGTTRDNEEHIASGQSDAELSDLGKRQARELGIRYAGEKFDAIFCSDLRRSYETARIAFTDQNPPIVKDARLRECDYGDWTRNASEEVEPEKARRIDKPFPGGESYEQTASRMKDFLRDLAKDYDGKKIMIVGHRATQYGLEYWIGRVPLAQAVTAPWKWQPGWTYQLQELP